jgi:hypothetical protein
MRRCTQENAEILLSRLLVLRQREPVCLFAASRAFPDVVSSPAISHNVSRSPVSSQFQAVSSGRTKKQSTLVPSKDAAARPTAAELGPTGILRYWLKFCDWDKWPWTLAPSAVTRFLSSTIVADIVHPQ